MMLLRTQFRAHIQTKSFRGFTLVETLVALSIFSLSIVALVTVSSGGLNNTLYAKNRLTATYLAQEGVELVRAMRDSDNLASSTGSGWGTFTASSITACTTNYSGVNAGCNISPLAYGGNLTAYACNSTANSDNCTLYIDPITGYYGDPSVNVGHPSIFRREIHVDAIGSADVHVTVTVYWQQGSGTQSVTVSDYLSNYPFNF